MRWETVAILILLGQVARKLEGKTRHRVILEALKRTPDAFVRCKEHGFVASSFDRDLRSRRIHVCSVYDLRKYERYERFVEMWMYEDERFRVGVANILCLWDVFGDARLENFCRQNATLRRHR